jgi:hypothetical protein
MGYMTMGVRMRIIHVDFVPDGTDWPDGMSSDDRFDFPAQFGFGSCGHVLVDHFRTRGHLLFNLTHDAVLNDITAQAIGGEEYCFDFFCSNIHIDGFGWRWDTSGTSHRIHLTNALILNHGFEDNQNFHSGIGLAPDSRLSNVTMMFPRYPTTYVYVPDRVTMENVTLDLQLVAQGKDLRLNNLHAPEGVVFQFLEDPPVDSTGIMLSPITPDPDEVLDLTEAGNWQRPLMVNRDGSANAPPAIWTLAGPVVKPGLIFPSPAADEVPLKIVGHLSQSVDLQRWQSSGGTIFWSIRSDGEIATNKSIVVTSITNPTKAIKVVDPDDGSVIGYLALYQSITQP